jgi:hypothetical protein
MNVSLFYKSCSKDFDWLKYSRDSVRRFCSGFSEIVLCLPEGETFDWPEAKIVNVRETFTPYLFQQAVKLYADTWCSGEHILFNDSDTIFTRHVTPQDFFIEEKPYWIIRPYEKARSDQQVWRGSTSNFIGSDVTFEGMARHPFLVPVSVLQRVRGFCQFKHGVSLDEYIKSRQTSNPLDLVFSEWNCLAAFAKYYCPEFFHWIDSSVTEPPPSCVHQGFTWGGEARKQEDLSKFREILGSPSGDVGNSVGGEPPTVSVVAPHSTPSLTIQSAIEFIASQVKDNPHKARVIRELKTAWKGKGVRVEKKVGALPLSQGGRGFETIHKDTLLLCIHSYPGANETMERHWPYFQKAGASRIIGIGTTDGKCTWPDGLDAVVDIGENAYMKIKGKDDHLCRRLLDTIKWCLTQPEDRFAIVEYDTLILRKFPKFTGVHAHLTGGQVNGSKTKHFYHNPHLFDRASGPALVKALEAALPDSQEYPDNSPDLFFGLAVERAKIPVKCCFRLFTRNSLDAHGDLDLAVQAALDGAHAIHGVKQEHELQEIERALNERHLSMSHVA